MRANGGWVKRISHPSPQTFPLGCPGLKNETSSLNEVREIQSESDTTDRRMKKRRGVGVAGRSSPAETRRSWGEDHLLSVGFEFRHFFFEEVRKAEDRAKLSVTEYWRRLLIFAKMSSSFV